MLVEIIKTLDRSLYSGHGEIGGHVSGVSGDDNKAKKPPASCKDLPGHVLWNLTPALGSQCGYTEPESLLQIEMPLLIIILEFKYNINYYYDPLML